MVNIAMSPVKTFNLTDFSGGIVTNVSAEQGQGISIADNILNFVPGIRGELKKAPIGLYSGNLYKKIEKILHYASKTGDRIFVSADDGTLYEHKPFTASPFTQYTFPSQSQMFGFSTGWTAQPTKITDGFTYGGYLFLLTGTKVNYFIDRNEVKIWGQRDVIPPATAEEIPDTWSALTSYSVDDALIITDTANDEVYLFVCTQAGTSGSVEPTWDFTIGNSTIDGTVIWKCDKGLKVKEEYEGAKYIYTYWDGYCESNPSSFMAEAVDTTTGGVRVKLYTGYGKTEQIRIYRWDKDNGVYRFVKAVDTIPGSDTYVYFFDFPYEYGFGEHAEFDNTPPPPCEIGTVFKNFVFLAGDKRNPERLYFSKLGNPFSFPDYHYIDVGQDDGDRITNLVALNDTLLIFKERNLYILTGYDTNTFEVRFIAPVGCVARNGAVAVDDLAYFVGYDGIYATNGMNIEKISFQIDDYFKWKPIEVLRNATVVYISAIKTIAFNVNKGIDGSGVYLADTFFYHIEHKAWTRANYGLTDGAVVRDKTYFVLGSKVYVYSPDTYASFTGVVETKWLPLATPEDRAIVRRISIIAGGVTVGSSMYVYYKTDYEDDWHLLTTVDFDGTKETVRVSCNIVGNYFKFKIQQSGEMKHFVGLILEYRTKGFINKDI